MQMDLTKSMNSQILNAILLVVSTEILLKCPPNDLSQSYYQLDWIILPQISCKNINNLVTYNIIMFISFPNGINEQLMLHLDF